MSFLDNMTFSSGLKGFKFRLCYMCYKNNELHELMSEALRRLQVLGRHASIQHPRSVLPLLRVIRL